MGRLRDLLCQWYCKAMHEDFQRWFPCWKNQGNARIVSSTWKICREFIKVIKTLETRFDYSGRTKRTGIVKNSGNKRSGDK